MTMVRPQGNAAFRSAADFWIILGKLGGVLDTSPETRVWLRAGVL